MLAKKSSEHDWTEPPRADEETSDHADQLVGDACGKMEIPMRKGFSSESNFSRETT